MKRRIKTYFVQLDWRTALRLTIFNFFRRIFNPNVQNTYSEYGEDILIERLLSNKEKGFYIDVGSNHPIRRSNTFRLYYNGWTGICIEPQVRLSRLHKKIRPWDKVVTKPVSDIEKDVKFYEFSFDLVSTMEESVLDNYKKSFGKIENISETRTVRLDTIIEEYKTEHQGQLPFIDLLSIDVEGHDLAVLKSIDLNKYLPGLIVIETLGFDFLRIEDNPIVSYLKSFQYRLVASAGSNSYFLNVGT